MQTSKGESFETRTPRKTKDFEMILDADFLGDCCELRRLFRNMKRRVIEIKFLDAEVELLVGLFEEVDVESATVRLVTTRDHLEYESGHLAKIETSEIKTVGVRWA